MDGTREPEIWEAIPGHPGYEVSDQGRVRSINRVVVDSWGRHVHLKGRTLKQVYGKPYWTVTLEGKRDKKYRVQTLVLEAFVGPRKPGQVIRHLNGKHLDNRLENLAWGTKSENQYDAVAHGVHACAAKTHCKYGHEFTPENTYYRRDPKNGRRQCRTCKRERAAARRQAVRDIAV